MITLVDTLVRPRFANALIDPLSDPLSAMLVHPPFTTVLIDTPVDTLLVALPATHAGLVALPEAPPDAPSILCVDALSTALISAHRRTVGCAVTALSAGPRSLLPFPLPSTVCTDALCTAFTGALFDVFMVLLAVLSDALVDPLPAALCPLCCGLGCGLGCAHRPAVRHTLGRDLGSAALIYSALKPTSAQF
ncbi:hypothetical protein AURDEDRAFT_165074 [Auricularia subglabra TFB-10046 SS5]|nr:hypothetical protein AURDEDRAFT_165074 [Auricularia subglabra TFB-10046 SS5]